MYVANLVNRIFNEYLALDWPSLLSAGITPEVLLRLGLAALAGGLLGIERERRGRAAGLRTTLLVCLAACMAMILSDSFYQQSLARYPTGGGSHPDPARLAAGVLSGMGFLGAGVIIREGNHIVRGVTTAAAIWFVTIIGLAFGAGAIGVGIVATLLSLLILAVIPALESMIQHDQYSDLTVWHLPSECPLEKVIEVLKPLKVIVTGTDLVEELNDRACRSTFHLIYKRRGMADLAGSIAGAVRQLPGVSRISFQS